MKVLVIGVEVSDQMGTSEEFVVGVFDNDELMQNARSIAEGQFPTKRTWFKVSHVEGLNIACKAKQEWLK